MLPQQQLDMRHTVGHSPWHWEDGTQHEKIGNLAALQAKIAQGGGLGGGPELVSPREERFAARAAALFQRDGFVCLRDALTPEQTAALASRVDQNLAEIFRAGDPNGGAKGAWRYAFGSLSKTGSCLHMPEWAHLVGLPAVDAVLTEVWGSKDFVLYMGGGDFVLPGSEYQPLHSDLGDASKNEIDSVSALLTDILPLDAPEKPGKCYTRSPGFFDPSHQLTIMDLPTPVINVHFTTFDWTHQCGPLRIVPGTQRSRAMIPALSEEPDWMKLGGMLCPLPAGTAIIRDVRTWHGGCPNVGDIPRAMPSTNYVSAFISNHA